MSLYLRFDKDLYGINGLIPLTTSDDWSLVLRVVDLVGGVELDQNISGSAVSAFFPAASGGYIQGTAVVTDPICGQVEIGLPQNCTSGAFLSNQGVAPYLTMQSSAGLQTLYPYDQPLQITARGAVQF
jgi:hypothetical protein